MLKKDQATKLYILMIIFCCYF